MMILWANITRVFSVSSLTFVAALDSPPVALILCFNPDFLFLERRLLILHLYEALEAFVFVFAPSSHLFFLHDTSLHYNFSQRFLQ
jgi:hypothetical protein